MFDIIRAIKEIFEEENRNNLFVNVSSGSKIQSIACMMSCMMFQEFHPSPYYVVPEGYRKKSKSTKSQSFGMKNIIDLPKYRIMIPSPKLIAALKIIHENGGEITKKSLADIVDKKLITVKAQDKNYDKVRYGLLDKHIIKHLKEEWHFVTVEKKGRNYWVKLTKEGEDAVKFLI